VVALAIIALIVFGICMISAGAVVEYIGGELTVSAKVCGMKLQLLSKKESSGPPKEKKPKKEKKKKEKAPEGDQPSKPKKKLKLSFNRDELLELLKCAIKGLGKFGKVTVNRFMLHLLVGGEDPYNTAMEYGWVNAALASLAPLCSRAFVVKESDVQTGVDFAMPSIDFDAALDIHIRLGQIFRVVFSILFGAAWILIKNKLRLRREKKLAPAPEEAAIDSEINNNDNSASEERKDDHGK